MWLTLIFKYRSTIITLVAFIALVGVTYYKGYSSGYKNAEEKYVDMLSTKELEINQRLNSILDNTDRLVLEADIARATKSKEYRQIIEAVKSTKIYNSEECKISKEYIELFNSAVRASNK